MACVLAVKILFVFQVTAWNLAIRTHKKLGSRTCLELHIIKRSLTENISEKFCAEYFPHHLLFCSVCIYGWLTSILFCELNQNSTLLIKLLCCGIPNEITRHNETKEITCLAFSIHHGHLTQFAL